MDSAAALPPGRLSGAAALFASATLFAVVSVLVKFASASYGQWYVSAVRFGLGAVLCLAVLAAGYRSYRPKLWPWLLARGAVGVAAMPPSAPPGRVGPSSWAIPIPCSWPFSAR
jgi:drug/metabolite transporter (DMT)-like permease